jgi:hypothetical protein
LLKETLDLLDIIRILGDRPFPLTETMQDYMKEIEMRKQEHKAVEDHKEDTDKHKDEKSDEHEKDKDLKGKDEDEKNKKGGTLPSPKSDQERQIQDSETIMKS